MAGFMLRSGPFGPERVAFDKAAFVDSNFYEVPEGSANGVDLESVAVRPNGTESVLFELAPGDSVSYGLAPSQPAQPPVSVTRTGTDMRRVEQPLGENTKVWITARTGTPKFQWL